VDREAGVSGHYSAQYEQFAADVHSQVRSAAFGEDIGQNSWLTADELERFAVQLELDSSKRLLDVACGSGGPALHLVRQTGCEVTGVELYAEAVASGNQQARAAGLESQAAFVQADATEPLPLETGSFGAILCIDAINHLRDRPRVFADWVRLLEPWGRLLFTDPLVVTGMLGSDEIAVRASIGYGLFVPLGENERLLAAAGLDVVTVEDTTEHMAVVARKRHGARVEHETRLRRIEGDDTFEGRQRFFDVAARLADNRQLSRYVYVAVKPG
jgi:SAM-dependent methyltransferase